MKKNAMLKIAAILMVAVLLTTCAISSTFAKYTTTLNGGSTTARVAEFGITVSNDAEIAGFSESYLDKNGEIYAILSAEDDNVFAPGATGSISAIGAVDGTAEVAVTATTHYSFEYTGFTIGTNNTEYFPLVFTATIGGVDKEYKHVSVGGTYPSITDLFNELAADTATTSEVIAAGESIADATATQISWVWAYEIDNNSDKVGDYDADDTLLAATNSTLTVKIKSTITQVEPGAAGVLENN